VAVVTDQRLWHRWQCPQDLVVEIGKTDLAARAKNAVLDDEPLQLPLSRLGQRVPNRAQIGKLGLAPRPRELSGRQQRAFRGVRLNELSVCQSWLPM
jgi:hypothetical protein